jgi:hypothetical protein
MLQVTCQGVFDSRADIWVLEFFDIVKELRAIEAAKQCLLEVLRLVTFHDLELTHTCSRESSILTGWKVMEEEEMKK